MAGREITLSKGPTGLPFSSLEIVDPKARRARVVSAPFVQRKVTLTISMWVGSARGGLRVGQLHRAVRHHVRCYLLIA